MDFVLTGFPASLASFPELDIIEMKTFFTAVITSSALIGAGQAQAEATGLFDAALGQTCWAQGYTNTAAIWTVTITSGEDDVVSLHGSGEDFIPMNATSGNTRFLVTGGVQASFSAVHQQDLDARVKFANVAIKDDAGQPVAFHTVVAGEDGSDGDWQDLLLTVTCLRKPG